MCPAERWRTKELRKESPMLTIQERVGLDDAWEVSGASHRALKGSLFIMKAEGGL